MFIENFDLHSELTQVWPCALTMGAFDGLHLGHRALLERVEENAKKHKLARVLLTYKPHPDILLTEFKKNNQPDYTIQEVAPKEIFVFEEKKLIFEKLGWETIVFLNFTLKLMQTSPEDFLKNILISKLLAKYIIIGYNQTFGRNREGNFDFLEKMKLQYGYEVEKVNAITYHDEVISSSSIRKFLLEGNLERANHFLGYNYFIQGLVVQGEKRGAQLGFPTANLDLPSSKLIPGDGVYIGSCVYKNKSYGTLVSIGKKPSFHNTMLSSCVEVYILDFHGDLYGKILTIELIKKLRGQLKFNNKEELIQQMNKDKEVAIQLIKGCIDDTTLANK